MHSFPHPVRTSRARVSRLRSAALTARASLTALSSLSKLTALTALAALSCAPAARGFGAAPEAARANALELFSALQQRFGPRIHDSAAAQARERFARYALAPSRLFRDLALWTTADDSSRTLVLRGAPSPAGYQIVGAGQSLADSTPTGTGEYRRVMRLRAEDDGVFTWHVSDELAAGPAAAGDLSRALGALLAAATRTSGADARDSSRAALPRTTATLARLFALDSLRLAPAPDGSTDVLVALALQPRRLAPTAPALARYVEKYAMPARVTLVAYDSAGVEWWAAGASGGRLTLRLRLRDGALAPLATPPAARTERLPGTFRIRADLSTRFGPFRVGARGLVGEVTLERASSAKAFTARFRQEPDWQFPPLVATLIRAPLRRPFAGDGASLRFAARDAAGTLVLERDYAVTVQESAIARWLGGLGGGAVRDFRAGAEAEYDRYLGEVLGAIRTDLAELLAVR